MKAMTYIHIYCTVWLIVHHISLQVFCSDEDVTTSLILTETFLELFCYTVQQLPRLYINSSRLYINIYKLKHLYQKTTQIINIEYKTSF